MLDGNPIADALEALIDALTPGSAAPAPPSGVDAWDVACQPRSAADLKTVTDRQAIEALTRLDPFANAVLNTHSATLDIALRSLGRLGTAGTTSRSATPGKSFDIRLNLDRYTPSRFDTAITLIHELAHVDRILQSGFLPAELVTAIGDVREFIALVWQFEFLAFEAMLAGAQSIRTADPTKYAECWHVSVANDAVLAALNAGNSAQARAEIKDLYPEMPLRTLYSSHHADPPPPNAAPLWAAYYGLGHSDEPALWGL